MLARAASRLSSARVGLPKSRKIHSSSKPKAIPFWPSSKLASEDSQLVNNQAYKTARAKFNVVASKDAFAKTQKALQEKGHEVTVVKDKAAALKTLQNLIPDGASINLAGSTSLSEIGFVDYLTTTDRWNNLKGKLLAEKDAQKQAALRRQAAIADFGIATVDAVTESGEFVMVDASGTRVVLALAPEKTVLVVGGQKLVKDMDTAWERVKTYSYVTESARMRAFYNGQVPGSTISNSYVSSTAPFQKGHFHLILIEEQVGY